MRENVEGVRLSFTIKYPPTLQLWRNITEIMQAQLATIGIEAVPTAVEGATLIQQVMDSRPREFDGWVFSWVTDLRLDDTALFHTTRTEGPNGWSGTQRPDIDHYLDRLPLILDREAAEPMWHAYQELLVDEQPFTFFFQPDRLVGVNQRIRGVVMDMRGEWVHVRDWWVPSSERRRRGR